MIKKATAVDALTVAALAINLWGDSIEEIKQEYDELLNDENAVVFIKYHSNEPVGFAQCQLRSDYVEGTSTTPVGYLEGIFIKEEFRNQGYAKELLTCCEKWSKEHSCVEFASDCELDNNISYAFHMQVGFTEANRIICFTKKL